MISSSIHPANGRILVYVQTNPLPVYMENTEFIYLPINGHLAVSAFWLLMTQEDHVTTFRMVGSILAQRTARDGGDSSRSMGVGGEESTVDRRAPGWLCFITLYCPWFSRLIRQGSIHTNWQYFSALPWFTVTITNPQQTSRALEFLFICRLAFYKTFVFILIDSCSSQLSSSNPHWIFTNKPHFLSLREPETQRQKKPWGLSFSFSSSLLFSVVVPSKAILQRPFSRWKIGADLFSPIKFWYILFINLKYLYSVLLIFLSLFFDSIK